MEIDWEVMADQECFPYSYEDGKITVLPEKPPLVRRSASGSEVHEGGGLEVGPKCEAELAHSGMSMKYGRLVVSVFSR